MLVIVLFVVFVVMLVVVAVVALVMVAVVVAVGMDRSNAGAGGTPSEAAKPKELSGTGIIC